MSPPHRHEGVHDLAVRLAQSQDYSAWNELLHRTLPEIWRRAIGLLGDSDPSAVARLVGGTLIAMAARLEEFQPASDDRTTYASFSGWWRNLMSAALGEIEPTVMPAEPGPASPRCSDASTGDRQPPARRESAPSRSVRSGIAALIRGAQAAAGEDQKDALLRRILPDLWRAAIQQLGDAAPRRVAWLVAQTVAAILEQLAALRLPVDEDCTDQNFQTWWSGLMAQTLANNNQDGPWGV